jgi:hypothetical protein
MLLCLVRYVKGKLFIMSRPTWYLQYRNVIMAKVYTVKEGNFVIDV